MRLSNAWRKVKFAGAIAFGVAMLLFSAWQLYSAWANGAVKPFNRGMDWVTFQSSPGWFVGSLIGYGFIVAMFGALLAATLIDYRTGWRWRTRQDLDIAIRQSPEER